MDFTLTQVTLASDTKLPAETASADMGYTTPNALASLTQTLTNKTLTSPVINLGSDATGDVYYRNSTGQFTRLGVGSNGQVLTLASGIPSWENASGGGGLVYITESINTSSPNSTVNVVSLTVTGGSTNADLALSPKGSGSIIARVSDGSSTGGNRRGTYSVDLQLNRNNASHIASGSSSVISGGARNTSSGSLSVCGGGQANLVSGEYGAVSGGSTNAATAIGACVVGGQENSSTAQNSFIGGGTGNIASGDYSWIGGGQQNTSSGSYSVANGYQSITRGITGAVSFSGGRFNTNGDCQYGDYILRRQTTNATPTELSTNNSSAASANQIILPNNHAYSFEGKVIARDTTGLYKIWHFTGGISRGANAAATVIGDYTIDPVHESAGTDTWSADFSANTTLGCLTLTVTGEADKTIRWASHIETIELG